MDEATVRAMIKDHFDTGTDDFVRSSEIYADDAVLEFPQGGERIRGKANIIAFRSAYPARLTLGVPSRGEGRSTLGRGPQARARRRYSRVSRRLDDRGRVTRGVMSMPSSIWSPAW
jgi:CelD/BcsL family acetyltransferase involved in cellulose biosynthesis